MSTLAGGRARGGTGSTRHDARARTRSSHRMGGASSSRAGMSVRTLTGTRTGSSTARRSGPTSRCRATSAKLAHDPTRSTASWATFPAPGGTADVGANDGYFDERASYAALGTARQSTSGTRPTTSGCGAVSSARVIRSTASPSVIRRPSSSASASASGSRLSLGAFQGIGGLDQLCHSEWRPHSVALTQGLECPHEDRGVAWPSRLQGDDRADRQPDRAAGHVAQAVVPSIALMAQRPAVATSPSMYAFHARVDAASATYGASSNSSARVEDRLELGGGGVGPVGRGSSRFASPHSRRLIPISSPRSTKRRCAS